MPELGKFCSACGAQNELDAAFCGSCGKPLDIKPSIPAPVQLGPAARGGAFRPVILAGGVLLALGISVAVIFVIAGRNGNSLGGLNKVASLGSGINREEVAQMVKEFYTNFYPYEICYPEWEHDPSSQPRNAKTVVEEANVVEVGNTNKDGETAVKVRVKGHSNYLKGYKSSGTDERFEKTVVFYVGKNDFGKTKLSFKMAPPGYSIE